MNKNCGSGKNACTFSGLYYQSPYHPRPSIRKKVVSLSTKEVIKIPNVVHNMIPVCIVQQYKTYSKKENFTPLSCSTLLRVLQVCPASTQKTLQGIDYISSAGAQGFDDLESAAERLGEMDMGMSWAKEKKEHLKKCKCNLKSPYQVCVLRLPGLYFLGITHEVAT